MDKQPYKWIIACLMGVSLHISATGYAQSSDRTGIKEVTSPLNLPDNIRMKTTWDGDGFDFNDRTTQEWSFLPPRTETGGWLCFPTVGGPYWVPSVNYPNPYGDDPVDDLNGSLKMCTFASEGVDDADYDWWGIGFISPNLEASIAWQAAEGYSVKILNHFADRRDIPDDTLKIYANLYVILYDQDRSEERVFAMAEHTDVLVLNEEVDPGWFHLDFDWSMGFPDVSNYDIRQVYVKIFGAPEIRLEGALYIDEVQPVVDYSRVAMHLVLWPHSIASLLQGSSEEEKFKIGNYGQLPLIYQAKSAPSESSPGNINNNISSSPNTDDMDVMITGWGNLDPHPALDVMVDHIRTLGYSVDSTNTFPASLDGYEILILVGAGSANEDIPENVVDAFVNAGNGLIIFEKVVESGDFNSSALSNPVQSILSGNVYRTGCTVVEPAHPLCQGLTTNCTFSGYSVEPVMKDLSEVVMRWNDNTVFAATYHLGTGKVVYINDLQAWYAHSGYWFGDQTNGMQLMENALNYVIPVDYHGIAWLSFDPLTGQVGQGQTEEITMTVSGNALSGTYTADIVILSNDLDHSITRIPFTMKVTTSTVPDLSVDAEILNFGTTISVLTVNISNEGGGDLDWSIEAAGNKPWLMGVVPTNGTNDASFSVAVDRNYLGLSSDTETLSISSAGGNQDITLQIQKQGGTLPLDWVYSAHTGYGASVIVPEEANPNAGGTPLTNDYYIGAFTPGGLCCGWSQCSDSTTGIAVWGDDPQTPEVEGFQTGETIFYEVYSMSQQISWTDVSVAYSAGTGNYANGAYMVLSQFDASSTHIDEKGDSFNMDFTLEPNYPNPFNPETTIYFTLPKQSHVRLAVYNIKGEVVEVLLDENRDGGEHKILWDARNLPTGIYFYRMEAEGFVKTHKMLLQK